MNADPVSSRVRVIQAIFRTRDGSTSGERSARALILPIAELTLIAMFAVWIGRSYLNFDPREVPFGREFMTVIQSNNLWEVVKACGWCALWNGSTTGGYPAAAELYGAPLHPIVAITTLLWGVINGTKVALIVSLAIAGLAQWWIAHELEVGWLPRIWSALIAVAGGHLAGRMDDGLFTILLSTAWVSLAIPAVLAVVCRGTRMSVVLLGLALASAIVAGQGYMQLGLLAASPALAFLLLDGRLRLRSAWMDLALACALAALLAAPFLVPFLHFLPNFAKQLDPNFHSAPPLEVLPLNLVIHDTAIYRGSGTLGMVGAPAPYTLFVGWVPVILAVVGLGLARGEIRRYIYFLAAGVVLTFMIASDVVLVLLAKAIPSVAVVRFPSFAAGLAIPMILGIAGYGLDRLLRMAWPRLMMGIQDSLVGETRGISLKWALVIPLVLNLRSDAAYAHAWLTTLHQGDDIPWIQQVLRTPDLEWVSPPFGEHYFITPTIVSGLKLSQGLRPWSWKGREVPIARLDAIRGPAPTESAISVAESFGIFVYLRPDEHYAAVVSDQGQETCAASGLGGRIRVACDTSVPGRLVVKENTWTGWIARLDGAATPLLGEQWLEVEAPAGRHTYEFRYLPWDVPLGLVLLAAGLLICGRLWFGGSKRGHAAEPAPPVDAGVTVEREDGMSHTP